jgi:hypothetical protein
MNEPVAVDQSTPKSTLGPEGLPAAADVPPEIKPVIHGDVVPFAKRGCRLCTGTGEFNVLNAKRQRTSKLCGCALRRFLKRHHLQVTRDTKTGRLFWLPAPALAVPEVTAP